MQNAVSHYEKSDSGTPIVKSAANTARVLRAFGQQPEWGVSGLARELGMTKSAVHRLVHTLVLAEFLERGESPGTYTLGPEVVRLARQAEQRNSLVRHARPLLRDLSSRTGDTATLAAIRADKGLYTDIVVGTSQMRFSVDVGDELQLHAGAGGKVLLAFQEQAFRERVLSQRLYGYTDRTTTDPDNLKRQLQQIHDQGYAFSEGEVTPGSRSIAGPVYDPSGRVVAAIILTAAAARIPNKKISTLAGLVCKSAEILSSRLGYKREQ